ncbi:MAG TPA: hypothetical protein VGF99_00190 [Myxococcota bacterium]
MQEQETTPTTTTTALSPTARRVVLAVLMVAGVTVWMVLAARLAADKAVWLVNGSDAAYDVILPGGERITLQPAVAVERTLGRAAHRLEIVRVDGTSEIVVADNRVPLFTTPLRTTRTNVLNPDGCAVLVTTTREYSVSRRAADVPLLFFGKTVHDVEVDLVDEPFPDVVVSSSNARATRTKLEFQTMTNGLLLIDRFESPETATLMQQRCARWR